MRFDQDPNFADVKYNPERVIDMLQKKDPALLEKICFAIVLPDAFIRCIEERVVARLQEHGFKLLNYSTKYLADADVEYLYKIGFHKKIEEARKTHWRMTRKGLNSGISLGLLLYHPDGDAVQRLLVLKGASNPSTAEPNSVRGSLVSFSKILALLHSSDDLNCVIRESSMFFAEDEFLEAISQGERESNIGIAADDVFKSIARTQPNDSPVIVFASISLRILGFINRRYPSLVTEELLNRTYTFSEAVRTSDNSWNVHADLYIEYIRNVAGIYGGSQWHGSIDALLATALKQYSLAALADAQLLLILKSLATGTQSLELDALDLCNHLRLAGIYHDEWEIKRLENFFFFREELLTRPNCTLQQS